MAELEGRGNNGYETQVCTGAEVEGGVVVWWGGGVGWGGCCVRGEDEGGRGGKEEGMREEAYVCRMEGSVLGVWGGCGGGGGERGDTEVIEDGMG